jgi:hypothetical protein
MVVLAIFTLTYNFYLSLLDTAILEPGLTGYKSASVRALAFSIISIISGIACMIEMVRWEKTKDLIILNKLFKLIIFPLLYVFYPIFFDDFILDPNWMDKIYDNYILIALIIFLWSDIIGIISKDLESEGLIDTYKVKLFYKVVPPKKLSDMYLSVAVFIGLFVVVIVM